MIDSEGAVESTTKVTLTVATLLDRSMAMMSTLCVPSASPTNW